GAGVEVIAADASQGTIWPPTGAIALANAGPIYPRRSLGAIEGAAPIAHLRTSTAGAIEMLDTEDRVRVSVVRGAGAAPTPSRVLACGGALALDLNDAPRHRDPSRRQ